jgi:hypothetical protein
MKPQQLNHAGPMKHELTYGHAYAQVLATLWARASHFALVRHGRAAVEGADVLTPTPEYERLKRAIAPLRERITEAKWVKEWPGTVSGESAVLWIKCHTRGAPPFILNEGLLWEGFEPEAGWDDFQLFEGEALRLFVCSHEQFGTLWGTETELEKLGLPTSAPDSDSDQIVGKAMDPAVLKALIGS